VQPFPPQPVVIASFQTAATFSRSDFCLIFIKLGKSFAISLTPWVVSLFVVIMMISHAVWWPCAIQNCKSQIPKHQTPRNLQASTSKTTESFEVWSLVH